MKILQTLNIILLASVFVNSPGYAASGGSGSSVDLNWACASLDVYSSGSRTTFCKADSPNAAFRDLYLSGSIQGTYIETSDCFGAEHSYLMDQTDGYYNELTGSTQEIKIWWTYLTAYFSYNDQLSASGGWQYRVYSPPSNGAGTSSQGPYTNSHGNCY